MVNGGGPGGLLVSPASSRGWVDKRWGEKLTDRVAAVVFSEIDRHLLERCLGRKPRAWEDFVDRFLGLFLQVIDHTAALRCVALNPQDREDLCAEVLLRLIENDFAILRRFRGQASLATYLAVVARRIVVKLLMSGRYGVDLSAPMPIVDPGNLSAPPSEPERHLADQDSIKRLLEHLEAKEAEVVRLFYLEGQRYSEIAESLGIPPNSVGPILSRARAKMRELQQKQGAPVG